MRTSEKPTLTVRCELEGLTTQDLMKPDPVFIRGDATDEDAIRLLADKGISAAVVISETGRPLGVLTATDVLIHQRAKLTAADPHIDPKPAGKAQALVRDIMTPAVFSVRIDTPARQLIEQMVALNVHRLFVVDDSDVVVGVVSALGILRGMV